MNFLPSGVFSNNKNKSPNSPKSEDKISGLCQFDSQTSQDFQESSLKCSAAKSQVLTQMFILSLSQIVFLVYTFAQKSRQPEGKLQVLSCLRCLSQWSQQMLAHCQMPQGSYSVRIVNFPLFSPSVTVVKLWDQDSKVCCCNIFSV